jgi:hypothetical protein
MNRRQRKCSADENIEGLNAILFVLDDRALHARRNEIERLFRRLKGSRRIFSRFDKLDVLFTGFLHFTLVIKTLRQCEHGLGPATEKRWELGRDSLCDGFDCHVHSAFAFEAGHAHVLNSARDDVREATELPANVQRESVHRNPAPHADTETGDFPIAHPNASQPFLP